MIWKAIKGIFQLVTEPGKEPDSIDEILRKKEERDRQREAVRVEAERREAWTQELARRLEDGT